MGGVWCFDWRTPWGESGFVVIWRAAIIAGYVALAVLIGFAYGGRGLAILFFLYFWAGAWAAFILAWNWASREIGRRYFHRLAGSR